MIMMVIEDQCVLPPVLHLCAVQIIFKHVLIPLMSNTGVSDDMAVINPFNAILTVPRKC